MQQEYAIKTFTWDKFPRIMATVPHRLGGDRARPTARRQGGRWRRAAAAACLWLFDQHQRRLLLERLVVRIGELGEEDERPSLLNRSGCFEISMMSACLVTAQEGR